MILKEKRAFNISQGATVGFLHEQINKTKQIRYIKYYSDAVFNPITYQINFKVKPAAQILSKTKGKQQSQRDISESKQISENVFIELDFQFLKQQTKNHKRILDNIGVVDNPESLEFSQLTKKIVYMSVLSSELLYWCSVYLTRHKIEYKILQKIMILHISLKVIHCQYIFFNPFFFQFLFTQQYLEGSLFQNAVSQDQKLQCAVQIYIVKSKLMQAQQQMLAEAQAQNQWKWVKCNLVLRRIDQNAQYTYESLCQQTQINKELGVHKNQAMVQISLQKMIKFDPQNGFHWHKSWMLPEITLKIKQQKLKMLLQYQQFEEIYCAVTSGYPQKLGNHFFLNQIRMEGDVIKKLNANGQFKFNNIRFSQTSFNCNRKKFSIIVIVYGKCKDGESYVIQSLVSNPIHIDSRKQARKKIPKNVFLASKIPYNKFVKSLEGMNKRKMKMKNRKEFLKYSKVEDNLQNFINYYTASNIRYKIKHPFYFGYHFPRTFKLFFNSQLLHNSFDLLTKIVKPMKSNSDQKYLCMMIRDPYEVQQQTLRLQKQKNKKSKSNKNDTYVNEDKKKALRKLLFYNKKKTAEGRVDDDDEECPPQMKTALLKKKLCKLIQSWKFYFIQVEVQTEIQCLPKKWKQISREQQLQSYLAFSRYSLQDQFQACDQRRQKKWQQFQIHQMICLSVNNSKKISTEIAFQNPIFNQQTLFKVNEKANKNQKQLAPTKWSASSDPNSHSDRSSPNSNQQQQKTKKKLIQMRGASNMISSQDQNKIERIFQQAQ